MLSYLLYVNHFIVKFYIGKPENLYVDVFRAVEKEHVRNYRSGRGRAVRVICDS